MNLFPLAFIMSVVWIGAISYEVTWLITVIGYTISVPDTVMGLSFLAVGTSIPEVFSSLIVSKQVIILCCSQFDERERKNLFFFVKKKFFFLRDSP